MTETATITNPWQCTPEDLDIVSAAYWVMRHHIKLQSGEFTWEGHEYLKEPLDYQGRRLCCRKGAQGGWTQAEVLKTMHGMIYGHYPLGCLYMFPTGDDVGEFSKSRFGPLISANRATIGRYVRDTDTTSLKRVGKSFLYLRGARLSQKIEEDSKESSKLRSISVDRAVFDEMDLMDPDSVEKVRGRMGHSDVKEEVFLSNPTLPDYGIDPIFKQSDQRHWFRHCACGAWTCAELSFPQCVKLYPLEQQKERRVRGYVACEKCGKPVGIAPGEWIPQVKANTDFMAGYQWSQLTSAFNDPADILDAFNDPPEGNLADVYRLRLGLPYAAAEDRLQESQVYSCCGGDLPGTAHCGPCAMGVDVGKTKHVVIGIRTGKDQYEIIRAVPVPEWNDIHDLAKRYNVKSAVIDIRPYEDSARAFQRSEGYPIHLCEYSESMPTGAHFDQATKIVKVNRTEIFDRTHRMVTTPGMLRIPRVCAEVKEFARQVCNCAKYLDRNKRTGVAIYRYKAVGDGADHFRNALNYFALAAGNCRLAQVADAQHVRPAKAINNFRVGARN